ncbi:MAG: type II secretion system F family protein [Propionibacteriaceae bacterium]|jgi:Flp pilus assembly protein TadB|nr:type II secretion system F family protein [Propionibacteriaceae bacterium]
MNVYAVAATAMVAVSGVVLLVVGLRGGEAVVHGGAGLRPSLSQRLVRVWTDVAPNKAWTLGAAVAGVVAALFTGWLVLLLVIPGVVIVGPLLLSAPPETEVAWLAALDRWLRAIIASLATGKSINEALKATARQAPAPLAEPVALLALRLRQRWSLDEALAALARGCAHAEVDAVAAALLVAGRRGGVGAGATLEALADSIQDRLAGARDTAAERAKPRIVVRQISVITVTVVGFAALTNPGYFAPYDSALGNMLLLALSGAYVAALLRLRAMSAAPSRLRVLAVGQLAVNHG